MAGVVTVDYLGRWEVEPSMETAVDVMRDLVRRGLQEDQFVPNAELVLKDEEIVLLDTNDNLKPEVWSYFTNSVVNPMAFVNKNVPGGGFSRVVIFTVLGVGHRDRNPVMLALQCLDSQPTDLVERLLDLSDEIRSRKQSAVTMPSMYGEGPAFASVHRRMSSSASSLVHLNGEEGGSVSSVQEQFRKPIPFQSPRVPEMMASANESLGFDRPSFVYDHTEDVVQKDTILLNYCIDDIETVCRELRASRADIENEEGTSKIISDYRATEFISVFQKVKLAFNLLGRLNPHVRDPNAADLLHHLFPPLAFLMDACLDLFDEDVQKEVASPFLTETTITLLKHCLSSREIGIWEACGDCWTRTKAEFGGPAVPYKPLFLDGWSPGYIVFPEEGAREDQVPASQRPARQNSGRRPTTIQNKSDTESDYGSDGSVYNVGKYSHKPDGGMASRTGGQEAWRDLLMKKNVEIALVTYTRESSNKRELSVVKGDYLEVLNSDRKWWKTRNKEQEIGYVPYTILKSLVYQEAVTHWEDAQREKRQSHRSRAETNRKPSPLPSPEKSLSPVGWKRQSQRPNWRPSPSPSPERPPSPAPSEIPPPPPQPAPQTPTVPRKSKKYRDRSNSLETSYSMADELKNVLSYYKEEKGRNLDIHKTPEIFIDQRSTNREVKEWLKAKQFSSRVLNQVEGMNGRQVLGMKREALETAFGKEEGGRLDSQIILSRNQTKYTQGRGSELRKVLEKAKQRAEKKKAEQGEDFMENSRA